MAIIRGTSKSEKLTGTDFADAISGLGGNDILFGGRGNDRLSGGDGNDHLFGGRGDDVLCGNDGNDLLDGGTGRDRMRGGKGHDIYIVDCAADKVIEDNRGGTDEVRTTLSSYTLGANVENLTFAGSGDFVGIGNGTHNRIVGGCGDDMLTGGSGNDAIDGRAGEDTAIFSGKMAEYTITSADGVVTIKDKVSANGDDGTDKLRNVEVLQFQDGKIVLSDTPSDGALGLASLDGTNGFRLIGIDENDSSGVSVSSAGDVNGDGFADLIVGAPNAGDNYEGESYVVFGKASWAGTSSLDLATLDGTNGFRLIGIDEGDGSGSASSAGDVNGDGFADLIVGAPSAGANDAGKSYVVFGKASWAGTPSLDLATLDGTNGFRVIGIDAYDGSGWSVSSAGDVNGDGFADLIVGAPLADSAGGATSAGESYVVYGKASWAGTSALDLATLDGTNGFRLIGVDAGDLSGVSVSSAGDVNGDGFADLIIGARNAGENYEGVSYVVFSKASWAGTPSLDLATLDGTNGFRLIGIDEGDGSGSVSSAGDVNGDGFADLIVGAPSAESAGGMVISKGESYVVFGKASWAGTPSLDLAMLDGTNGFSLTGVGEYDYSGHSVSSAGDVDGDGFADLIVGAPASLFIPGSEPYGAGESYVVFGKASWAGTPSLDLATLDGTNGFRLIGIDAFDLSGYSVSSAGDVNGDGFGDLIVGAPGAESAGGANSEGESYIIFGGNFSGSVTHLGGAGDDALTGTVAAETFVGGTGNDTLLGNGGADAFQGGAGDDAIVVGSVLPLDVNGGSGIDSVNLDALGASIDLSGLDSSRFVDIEKIDLCGASANTLVLDAQSVFDMTGTNGDSFADNTLLVKGDASDAVRLAGNWTKGATQSNPLGETGKFVSYTSGEARVLVESDLTVQTGVLAALDLATLDGTNGFRLIGIDVGAQSGRSVSSAEDVNGDGFADLIVGAPFAGEGGESYVVFGKASWAGTPSLDLATLDGTNGFRLIGEGGGNGVSVSSAGDVNGDGFADLIIGAPGVTSYDEFVSAGESYVVFGKASWAGTPSLSLAALNGTNGFRLTNVGDYHFAGTSVSSAGDVNGDGFDDLIVGAPAAAIYDEYEPGTSYVVFGKASWAGTPSLNLASGFGLGGADLVDLSGYSVSSAGDVNGDGFGDLIVGAPGAESAGGGNAEGESYVVFGKASWTGGLSLASLDGTNGFRLVGGDEGDGSGKSVSSAGDVNGDGFADLIVGASFAESAGGADEEGESYVVFGKATWAGVPSLDLATLDGTNGFSLVGIDAGDFSGWSVSSAGDVNGDGFADVIVSAPFADSAGGIGYEGESYVVYGKADWAGTPSLDLAGLDGTNGFRLNGIDAFDRSGFSVSSAGDVNGDGFADLIVGAPTAESTGGAYEEGESYVIFGGNFTGAVTHLGGAGDDKLTGTAAAETFVGGTGNDTLIGNGGADAFQGGAGNDAIVIGSTLPFDVNGGSGIDVVNLDALGAAIDLTGLDNSKFVDIEKIDLGGANANMLKLDAQSVFGMTGTNGDSFADNALLVKGDAGDTVSLAGSWTKGATVSDPFSETGNFTSYTSGEAKVLLESDLTVLTGALAVLDLATLDGTSGFRLIGVDENDGSGRSVSSAGDVNGDGFADLIVGARYAESGSGTKYDGENYVVFGKASWAGVPSLDLATLDGTNGFRLIGVEPADYSGRSVSSAGDVNGDGFADVIVGARGRVEESGSYVVFGKASWAGMPSLDLATLDGTNGFRLTSVEEFDFAGHSVSSAGDVNGDGFDDVIVGAPAILFSDAYDVGESYVVFGKASWAGTPSLDFATLDGTNGFSLIGTDQDDLSGFSVSSAGDINGDGLADLVVGTPDFFFVEPYSAGRSYVVFGKESWAGTPSLDLATLDGTNGFSLIGIETFDASGFSVSSAGDVNGDGFDDVIAGSQAGESYVVFGKASWVGTPSLDLAALDGTNGFRLIGGGSSVSSAGDVNGDGFEDVIVGAPGAESAGGAENEGESYVVYGKASWAGTPSLDLLTLDGTNGFRLIGIDAGDESGHSVSAAGDVNGDGFADLLVGAPNAESAGGADAEGESYVVFGGNFNGAVTHLGTAGDDTQTGTAVAETFVGGTGKDTLIGKGGADAFQGGAGDDTMRVSTPGFLVADGGTGSDTLALDGSGLHLDLTALSDSRTRSIERIDITGNGNNTLSLGVLDVLNLSEETNELLVLGDAGDTVNRGADWTVASAGGTNGNGTSTIDGKTYQIYNAGQAALLVDTDMTVNA